MHSPVIAQCPPGIVSDFPHVAIGIGNGLHDTGVVSGVVWGTGPAPANCEREPSLSRPAEQVGTGLSFALKNARIWATWGGAGLVCPASMGPSTGRQVSRRGRISALHPQRLDRHDCEGLGGLGWVTIDVAAAGGAGT